MFIAFTRGVPPEQVPPVDELANIAADVVTDRPTEVFQYPSIGGNLGDEWLAAVVAERAPAFLYTIPCFQDRSGVCASEETRRAVVELADRHGFPIVEDTPYRRLRHHGLVSGLARLAEGTYLSATPLSQMVAARALEIGVVDSAVATAVSFLGPRHDSAVTAARAAFGDQVVSDPGGGYFVSVLAESALSESEFLGRAEAEFATGAALLADVLAR
ncbi:hypothetical protein L6E12_20390 [Actinokineospora sp. PR83]|uniref:hypothetical protein n=1 Tax=Actinokineospora sp. PR83 TaxID=2884908 RepID=UPI001F1645FE|nr:hypothetical protein [Actinokineospora sp. PR83]MCG8918145.1 hypothetical protein [Actinokineospora sp. PR83]